MLDWLRAHPQIWGGAIAFSMGYLTAKWLHRSNVGDR
jgi:hypothetical protein